LPRFARNDESPSLRDFEKSRQSIIEYLEVPIKLHWKDGFTSPECGVLSEPTD